MKFGVSSSTLSKVFQIVSGAISGNTVLPILEDFLLDLNGDQLQITASDLETSLSTTIEVNGEEDGKVAIPAKMIADIVKSLPDQPITISIDPENYGVFIGAQSGNYRLAGENGDDFPQVPQAENIDTIELPPDVLSDALQKTLFAVSNDELRPAMTGVFIDMTSQGITFVSTDAHKLVKYSINQPAASPSSFILPKKAASLLKNIVSGKDASIRLQYNRTNAFFTIDDTHLICRLVDAKFPDYNVVIPLNNPYFVELDRTIFQNALRRISIFANKATYQVLLDIGEGAMKLYAQDLDFSNEATENLSCNYSGQPMKIAFNAKFLAEILNSLQSNQVKIELSEPNKAGIVMPVEDEPQADIKMLIMPIMMKNQPQPEPTT